MDLTITRLHLADQRRDLVEATRWLGAEDRELLSLWWLEAAGQLTRTDVTAGLGSDVAAHGRARAADEGEAGRGALGRARAAADAALS